MQVDSSSDSDEGESDDTTPGRPNKQGKGERSAAGLASRRGEAKGVIQQVAGMQMQATLAQQKQAAAMVGAVQQMQQTFTMARNQPLEQKGEYLGQPPSPPARLRERAHILSMRHGVLEIFEVALSRSIRWRLEKEGDRCVLADPMIGGVLEILTPPHPCHHVVGRGMRAHRPSTVCEGIGCSVHGMTDRERRSIFHSTPRLP